MSSTDRQCDTYSNRLFAFKSLKQLTLPLICDKHLLVICAKVFLQDTFIMETCVLIPPEFSLVLRPRENTLTSPIRNGFKKSKDKSSRIYEMGVCVWSNQNIRKGTCFLPFQGTIRLDRLEVFSLLDDNDVSVHNISNVITFQMFVYFLSNCIYVRNQS